MTDWRVWLVIGVGYFVVFCLGIAFEREMWLRQQKKSMDRTQPGLSTTEDKTKLGG